MEALVHTYAHRGKVLCEGANRKAWCGKGPMQSEDGRLGEHVMDTCVPLETDIGWFSLDWFARNERMNEAEAKGDLSKVGFQ